MSLSIVELVQESIKRMTATEPDWLKTGLEPEFETVDLGGSGPRIILLHGLFGAVSNWEDVLPLLGEFSRVSALKFRF